MATNKIVQDFIQVENDLLMRNGDFVIGNSDNQHIEDILTSEPGWWKEFPLLGAALRKLLKAKANVQTVEAVTKQQLEADGYQVGRPMVTVTPNGKGTIAPNAVRIKFE